MSSNMSSVVAHVESIQEQDSHHCRHQHDDSDYCCNKSVDNVDNDTATVISLGSSTASSSGSSSSEEEEEEEEQSISSLRLLHNDDDDVVVDVEAAPSVKNIIKPEAQEEVECFQAIIVGAGAAGLQCAHTLIHEHGWKPSDILILEARNRAGGRICTITTNESSSSTSGDGDGTTSFTRDLGAAWVHGTRLDSMTNPVLELLRQSAEKNRMSQAANTTSENSSRDSSPKTIEDVDRVLTISGIQNDPVLRDLIEPVQEGNPWMRPQTILHDSGGIALYVQHPSQSLPETTASTTRMDPNDGIIQQALQEHFTILDQVSKKVTAMYNSGQGMETIHCSVGRYLQEMNHASLVSRNAKDDASDSRQDQIRKASALTGFYQHLLTCWYGRSLFDLQLGYFDTTDDDADNDNRHGNAAAAPDATFVEHGDFAGPHCTVRNGMHQVLEPLLQTHDLEKNCIRLGQVVTSIYPSNANLSSSGDGAVIVVEKADGRCIYGKTCVVTLPLGCLRQEQSNASSNDDDDDDDDKMCHNRNYIFSKTPLSEEKQSAIQHMNMGAYKKVFLTFDRCFWDTKPAFLGLVLMTDDNDDQKKKNPLGNCLLLNNLHKTRPCLEAILAGEQGTWATGKSDEVIQAAVLDFMQRAMMPTSTSDSSDMKTPSIKDWCKSCHVTRWEEDPYSRGAYSSWSLGALPRHAAEMSRPEWNDRLYFAGEATHDGFEGSVHAALLSGKHAASLVSKHLSAITSPSATPATTMQPETSKNMH